MEFVELRARKLPAVELSTIVSDYSLSVCRIVTKRVS